MCTDDFICCEICGKKFKTISSTHLKKHGITVLEYSNKFPDAPLKCKNLLKKMSELMTGRKILWKEEISNSLKKRYERNPDGWGRTGFFASDETKKKISEKTKGRILTKEQKKYISIKTKESFEKMNYIPWNKGLTKESSASLKSISLKNTGRKHSEKTKEKLRKINLGKKHTEKTKNKLSKLFSGDKNPAKRLDVRQKMKENHASNNPDLWEKTVEKIRNSQKGKKLTEEHKEAIAKGKRRSLRYGSKSQLIVFEYMRKFFKINYGINVYSNDHEPFKGCSKNYSVDISIPQYKISIEWDGFWHWDETNTMLSNDICETKKRDEIKNNHLSKNGWKIIRIKDKNKDSNGYRKYAIKKCREHIEKIIDLIDLQPECNDWEYKYLKKDYIRINISDLSERKKCQQCNKWIIKKGNKTGMCKECYDILR
ncbi:MAG TPA: MucR family transcriptional regulator [Candidatus Paceibacterota bacterium]|nr:MucR family transcriptional regulator [Candidatus Paceibacterota bacterium]